MSRTDEEVPPAPPRKRRALEAADARHLAIWANDESLSPGDRKRAQEERDRRKKVGADAVSVGVLEGAGATPEQTARLAATLATLSMRDIKHPFCSKKTHAVCRDTGKPVWVVDDPESVARECDVVIGLPHENALPLDKVGPVWGALRLAKDRKQEVVVIFPSGQLLKGRW